MYSILRGCRTREPAKRFRRSGQARPIIGAKRRSCGRGGRARTKSGHTILAGSVGRASAIIGIAIRMTSRAKSRAATTGMHITRNGQARRTSGSAAIASSACGRSSGGRRPNRRHRWHYDRKRLASVHSRRRRRPRQIGRRRILFRLGVDGDRAPASSWDRLACTARRTSPPIARGRTSCVRI
jgi:hypothetical protein